MTIGSEWDGRPDVYALDDKPSRCRECRGERTVEPQLDGSEPMAWCEACSEGTFKSEEPDYVAVLPGYCRRCGFRRDDPERPTETDGVSCAAAGDHLPCDIEPDAQGPHDLGGDWVDCRACNRGADREEHKVMRRWARARAALDGYRAAQGMPALEEPGEPCIESLGDLLADLRHYADLLSYVIDPLHGDVWGSCLMSAEEHYTEERAGG